MELTEHEVETLAELTAVLDARLAELSGFPVAAPSD
jgi:hypothetical protein